MDDILLLDADLHICDVWIGEGGCGGTRCGDLPPREAC